MKIKIKYIVFILSCIYMMTSCSKGDIASDYPNTIFTEPVFKVAGTIGQGPLDIRAGDDNFYMYTDFEQDSTDLFSFIGRFGAANGTSTIGDEELIFKLKSRAVYPNNVLVIDEALTLGALDFGIGSAGIAASYEYFLNGLFLSNSGFGQPDNSLWQISNGLTSEESNFSFTVNNNAPLEVTYSTNINSGCSSSFTGTISPNPNSNFLLNISYELGMDNDVNLIITNSDLDSIQWSTGETSQEINVDFSQIPTGGQSIEVIAIDQFGQNASATIFVRKDPGQQPIVCMSLFSVEVDNLFLPGSDFGTVEIDYQKDGVKYSTNLGDQPEGKFNILEVEDYDRNENGFLTKKLQVSFNCLLYNNSGEFIPLIGQGSIGIAYPD